MSNDAGFHWPFKFQPYESQAELMIAIHSLCKRGGGSIGVFESPTGTGKTLSVICSALHFVLKHVQVAASSTSSCATVSALPDWVDALPMETASAPHSKRRIPTAVLPDPVPLQFVFCSRTHSQLSQFISELRRVEWNRDIESPRVITLGSRRQLCINPDVQKLGSLEAMNERCAELCQSGGAGCPYKRSIQVEDLACRILESPRDIEDLVRLGRDTGACPYYATRHALPSSHAILAPYQTVMSNANRDAIHLDLSNRIVVIDEAHNISDAIDSMHTADLTSQQLHLMRCSVLAYRERFAVQLNTMNLSQLKLVLHIITQIEAFLSQTTVGCALAVATADDESESAAPPSVWMDSALNFRLHCGFDHLDLRELHDWLEQRHHKIAHYCPYQKCTRQHTTTMAPTTAKPSQQWRSSLFRPLLQMMELLLIDDMFCIAQYDPIGALSQFIEDTESWDPQRFSEAASPIAPGVATLRMCLLSPHSVIERQLLGYTGAMTLATDAATASVSSADRIILQRRLGRSPRALIFLAGTLQPFSLMLQQLLPTWWNGLRQSSQLEQLSKVLATQSCILPCPPQLNAVFSALSIPLPLVHIQSCPSVLRVGHCSTSIFASGPSRSRLRFVHSRLQDAEQHLELARLLTNVSRVCSLPDRSLSSPTHC